MATDFVHLHVHSHYSLLDGLSPVEQLARRAAEMDMSALALTDHGAMHGVVDFYKACRQEGIRPLLGCEVYVAQRTRHDRTPRQDDDPYHLVLLAENETGYRNLVQLSTRGFLEGFYYRPRVDRELLAAHSQGLIALSGCLGGELPRLLRAGERERARETALFYREVFGRESFYLELQDQGLEGQREVNAGLVALAAELGVGLVATNDAHYLKREDARAHDILLCIQTLKNVDDPDRLRFPTDAFYLKSGTEMAALFAEVPQALTNTRAVAERASLEFTFGRPQLPQYRVPAGHDPDSYLEEICERGLARRYPEVGPDVRARLDRELKLIRTMGYSGYFLMVWDFVRFARERGIPVGPGRGSVAGSLVAYLLRITDIDPIGHHLLFDRFLNPERVDLPDFDIDFCFERRQEVIDYVVRQYGEDRVAQIITFGTMAARAAIRDVGRAMNLSYAEVDRVAKAVPWAPGMTLERALESTPELRDLVEGDSTVASVVEVARLLEGTPRHASVHAAGLVIARDPLIEKVPLQRTADGHVVTQFSMGALQDLGVLKTDFLGLRTLTVIDQTVRSLRRDGVDLDIEAIALDDPEVYRLLAEGETSGLFQLESSGMTDLLRRLRPCQFTDLVAALALFRPGPLGSGMIDDFVDRRHGRRPIEYLHPVLEPILAETYGVMVYQEQVMRVVSEMAGFSLAEADLLRRAVAKKKAQEMAAQRQAFLDGAAARGVEQAVAERVFELIAHFAGYGFNKSHTAPYALIAYRTAYLKVYHPLPFMAALLTSVSGSSEKVAGYLDECRRKGVTVLPPDVNESEAEFTVAGDRALRFGLAAVKNVGAGAVEAILGARREGGAFLSLVDFCERVEGRLLGRRGLESLIKGGAFGSLGAPRSRLMAALDNALEAGQQAQRLRENGQLALFEGMAQELRLPEVPEFPPEVLLAQEKEMLGLFLTGHPLAEHEEALRRVITATTAQIREAPDGHRATVGGMIVARKHIMTRAGEPMLRLTLEDLTGQVEVVVFPRVYSRYASILRRDGVFVIQGRVAASDEELKLHADEVRMLEAGGLQEPEPLPTAVIVQLTGPSVPPDLLERIKGTCRLYPGPCPVYLKLAAAGKTVRADRRYWVEASAELVALLQELAGPGSVTTRPLAAGHERKGAP
ncbi:MAG: DNA polymerase III subunit alpha [bacterium]|nr:DNA polymerase III subunit alpha [bacterium]